MNADAAVTLAVRLADRLPESDVRILAAAVSSGASGLAAGRQRAASAPLRAAYDEVDRLIVDGCPAEILAGCLLGAARAIAEERRRQQIDVVWSGPDSEVRTSRLTSAVIVDLIESAREEILLVSYATQTEPAVAAALHAAAERGVAITLLLERVQDNPAYRGAGSVFAGVRARRLSWPAAHRLAGASMHAKILVIDRLTALVGSANLTGSAMDRNLECGVLIRGGEAPGRIHAHVMSQVDRGDLEVLE